MQSQQTNRPQLVSTGLSTIHMHSVHCRYQRETAEGGRKRDNVRGSDAFQVLTADWYSRLMVDLLLCCPGRPLFFCSCLGRPPLDFQLNI